MATIKEVAKLSGVSVATVSRVINKSDSVTEKTKIKVLDAIDKLGYNPNLLGRNLRQSKTYKILVLLPTVSNAFYSRIVSSIEKTAALSGYNTMLCVTGSDAEKENRYLDLLKTKLVDGAIFLTCEQSAEEISELAVDFPVVQCCEMVENSNTAFVGIDNYKAAYEAVKYLQEIGHRKIAFVGVKNGYVSADIRLKGYLDAMKDADMPVLDGFVSLKESYSYRYGEEACRELLSLKERPTAVFTVADSLAIGFIRTLHSNSIETGKEMSVIGFDDTAMAKMYIPSITTVAQPRALIGEKAVELLLEQMECLGIKRDYPSYFLEHELKIRESTGKLSAQ